MKVLHNIGSSTSDTWQILNSLLFVANYDMIGKTLKVWPRKTCTEHLYPANVYVYEYVCVCVYIYVCVCMPM